MRSAWKNILFLLQLFGFIAIALSFTQKSIAQAYCVEKAGAKFFKKPNETGKTVWSAPIHTPLMGTGNRINQMVEVIDMSKKKFWTHKKNLDGRKSCLVVQVKKTNLRTGPGLSYKPAKVKYAERFEAFVDLGGEDGWTQIEDDRGNKAWVNLDQVWKPKNRMRISFDEGK